MSWLLGWLLSTAGRWVAGAGAVLGAVVAVFWAGKRAARQEDRAKAERKRADDMERIAKDMAESGGDRPDAARDWLRDFGDKR